MPYISICCLSLSSQKLIIMVSKRMEITGPHTGNWSCDWLCASGMLQTNLPTVNILVPSDFHHFGLFASPKQAVTCHQTPDTNCFFQDTRLWARSNKCLNISSDYMEVWCVPSAKMCHVYTKFRTKYWVSNCLSPNVLYSCLILYLCYGMLYLICHRWMRGM